MSQASRVFGSSVLVDPRKYPKGAASELNLTDTGATGRNDTAAEFWTAGIAAQGAQVDSNFTTDTYKDLIDVTSGAGVFVGAIGPTAGGAETTTFRITVDGTEYEIAVTVASGDRAYILPFIAGGSLFTSAGIFGAFSVGNMLSGNQQFDLNAAGNVVPDHMTLKAFGTPLVEYGASLKVEVKHSTNITGTGSNERRSGVLYYDGYQ